MWRYQAYDFFVSDIQKNTHVHTETYRQAHTQKIAEEMCKRVKMFFL